MFVLVLCGEFLIKHSSKKNVIENAQANREGNRQRARERKRDTERYTRKKTVVERKKNEVETFLKNNNLCQEHLFA